MSKQLLPFALGLGAGLALSSVVFRLIASPDPKGEDPSSQIEDSAPNETSLVQEARQEVPQHDPASATLGGKLGAQHADVRVSLNLVGKVDRLYDNEGKGAPYPFAFNEAVVEVFDDMVSRSVPLYGEAIDFLIYWVDQYYQQGSRIYDLGCSTGTTLDALIRGAPQGKSTAASAITSLFKGKKLQLIGVDSSKAMIEKCKLKLERAMTQHDVTIDCADIVDYPVTNASVVILNYTLQFIDYEKRDWVLSKIYDGLRDNGMLFLSEKVRSSDPGFQETCVHAYEDFKYRRGYSKQYVAAKKLALTNVLVPYTEKQLIDVLEAIGFDHVQTCVKWNCFVSVVARKRSGSHKYRRNNSVKTPHLDGLFDFEPHYLKELSPGCSLNYESLCDVRRRLYHEKGQLSGASLASYDGLADLLLQLPRGAATVLDLGASSPTATTDGVVVIGEHKDLTEAQHRIWRRLVTGLAPWRKGPFRIFGTDIEAEWRCNWKWQRLLPKLPTLANKVVCDLGCGNGYFMLRMLAQQPKWLVGLDPNLHAWLEFQMFKRFIGKEAEAMKFELMRGENIDLFPNTFDTVFCLGVLYHTPDPVGMLRKIRESIKRRGTLIVDCQGISGQELMQMDKASPSRGEGAAGEDALNHDTLLVSDADKIDALTRDLPICLFPKKKYANMKGVYFLPTLPTLLHWLARSGFPEAKISVIWTEPLAPAEQRSTPWAQVSSLPEALKNSGRGSNNRSDADSTVKSTTPSTTTIEDYPRPYRFYLRADV